MTLQDAIRARNLTKYRLSKEYGIPWSTLSDICSGKSDMHRCNAGTMVKLSRALELTVGELLTLDIGSVRTEQDGKPADRSYLEADLPDSVQTAVREYRQGEQENSPYLDCLWDELYGAINANMHGGRISEEQAVYLRSKYLSADREDDE